MLSLVVIFVNPSIYSDEQDQEQSKFAVQFGITDLIALDGLNGSMFSAKYDFNEKYSLAFGVSGSLYYDKEQLDNLAIDDGDPYGATDKDANVTDYSISVSVIGMRYLTHRLPVRLYLGLGLNLFYSARYVRMSGEDTVREEIIVTNEDAYAFGGGPELIAGTEWRFSERFALFAQYSIYAHYTHDVSKVEDYEGDDAHYLLSKKEFKTDSFSVHPLKIALGMSIYL
jgi:hypothetical protein